MEIEGVDEELAILRLQLEALLKERPDDFPLLIKGIELIARVVAARYRMSAKSKEELADAVAATLTAVGQQFFPERFDDV
jgi:hypothetical protein